MKEFWRKHCTTVIAGIMLIAIIVLLYVILTSTPLIFKNEAQADDLNSQNGENNSNEIPVEVPLIINEHPRAASTAMGFSSLQTLMGGGEEILLDSWSFLDTVYLIIRTTSKDLDFNSAAPSLSVAVLDKEGTLNKVALLNSDPIYLSSKITPNGLMLLVAENNKTSLLLFNGETFSVLSDFPNADSAKMYMTLSEVVFTLSTEEGIYFCKENGYKQLLSREKSDTVDIMLLNNMYYLFFNNKIILLDSTTNTTKILTTSKTLVSVLPTVIDDNFGFLTVESEGSIFYSSFYKQTSFSASSPVAEKILILGRADNVFLTQSSYGYTYVLSSDAVDILSFDSTLSSPLLVNVAEANQAYAVEAYGTDVYLIAKINDTVYLVKRGSNTVKTELFKGEEGKILVSGGKIWAIVCSDDISLVLCA